MSLSNILKASQLYEFNFYADAHIYRGAIYQGDLFKLVGTYSASQSKKALSLAHHFEFQKTRTVISKKPTGEWYVWVEIRSLIEPTPLARLTIQDHQSTLSGEEDTSSAFSISPQNLMSA